MSIALHKRRLHFSGKDIDFQFGFNELGCILRVRGSDSRFRTYFVSFLLIQARIPNGMRVFFLPTHLFRYLSVLN